MTANGSIDGGGQLERREALGGPIDPGATGATARGRARWGIFVSLAVAVVVADQLTKAWLVATVAPGGSIQIVGDLLRLINSQNSGALFGMFRDQAILFGLVSIGVVGLIVAYHGRAGRNAYLSVALGLLLGGALGNLADRFRLGYVVDWIDAGIGGTRFWTFNVADAAVTTAILLLLGLVLFPGIAARLGAPDIGTPDA